MVPRCQGGGRWAGLMALEGAGTVKWAGLTQSTGARTEDGGVARVGGAGDIMQGVAREGGAYPVEVEVGLPAVPPEEDGGLGVGAGDGLPADEEPHHRPQHQRRVQRPEGQRGPQPLRPPPRLLCAGTGVSVTSTLRPPQGLPSRWPSPRTYPKTSTPMVSTPVSSTPIISHLGPALRRPS